jgi:predicted RNA-binding protein with PIN domain
MVMAMGAAVVGATALHAQVRGVRDGVDEHAARRRREAGFANRLGDRLDPSVRAQLERLARPPAIDEEPPGAITR